MNLSAEDTFDTQNLMKKYLILLPVFCFSQLALNAQVTVVVPTPAEPDVVVVPTPAEPDVVVVPVPAEPPVVVVPNPVEPPVVVVRTLDPVVVRQQLSLPPRVVTVNPEPVVVPAPQTALKTTKTTTVVDTPGQPRRVYNSERNVVVVLEEQGQSRELTYVTLPVLFVKETNELLDQESRVALQDVAAAIVAVNKTEPGARFDIEGHTSTDGTDEFNLALSATRAQRVFDELTQNYGIPANLLSAHGYGEAFPTYPEGTEEQMQQDRRVLVVRTE